MLIGTKIIEKYWFKVTKLAVEDDTHHDKNFHTTLFCLLSPILAPWIKIFQLFVCLVAHAFNANSKNVKFVKIQPIVMILQVFYWGHPCFDKIVIISVAIRFYVYSGSFFKILINIFTCFMCLIDSPHSKDWTYLAHILLREVVLICILMADDSYEGNNFCKIFHYK